MLMWRAGGGSMFWSTLSPMWFSTWSPMWGRTIVPPFSIAAYATASCNGVTSTSPCPTARLTLSPTVHGPG